MVNDLLSIFIPHIILVLTIIIQMIFGIIKTHSLVFKYKDINITISNTISILGITAAVLGMLISSGNYAGLNYSIVVTPDVKALSILLLLCGLITVFLNTNLLRGNRPCCYKYHILLLTGLLGGICALGANDFLTLFISLETLTFALYFLIAFPKGYNSKEAAFKYLVINAVSIGFFLFGVSYILGLTSSLNFSEISHIFEGEHNGILYTISSIMIFAGLAMKLAIFPFANWVIDVYAGSESSVLNFLSTVPKIVVTGVIIRLASGVMSYSAEVYAVMLILGLITALWANVYAIKETNVKKILACSSAANAGYMIVVMAVFSNFAASAVIFYLICYAFMVMGVFAYLNMIEPECKIITLDKLSCGGSKVSGAAFALCCLGLAGLPATSGFVGKIFLLYSLIQSGLVFLPVVLILLLLFTTALYYYIKLARGIIRKAAEHKPVGGYRVLNSFSRPVLYMMSLITILIGVVPFNLIARCLLLF